MTLTPTEITPGAILANGRGRFRLIVNMFTHGDARIAAYEDAYTDAYGKMQGYRDGSCLVAVTLNQYTRLATPEERAEVVRCLNPKGIDHV